MDQDLNKTGLVLEGGGLRGVYTSGVLRFFMERNLYFPYVIGVSMGACNAANYLSRQIGRNRIVNIQFVRDRRYLSLWRLLRRGELFGMDFIFDTIPNQLVPFDFQRFARAEEKFWIVATDCFSGDPVYFEKSALGPEFMKVLQASCSLPFIQKPVPLEGRLLMDGGIADAVPIEKSLADGNERHVLVLTRPQGYRKKPFPAPRLARLFYPRFPGLCRALASRHERYNRAMECIDTLERKGSAFVIRPGSDLGVGRVERHPDRLHGIFEQGYADARASWAALETFLSSR
jgi:predicted patatin/cPLA2 family phospholipase